MRSNWLSLAASPTFAMMALLTAVYDGGAIASLCGPAPGASALTGMLPMYVLMSVFHAPPWLTLIGTRRAASATRHVMQGVATR